MNRSVLILLKKKFEYFKIFFILLTSEHYISDLILNMRVIQLTYANAFYLNNVFYYTIEKVKIFLD